MIYDSLTHMTWMIMALDMHNRKGAPTKVDLKQTESI